jgi:tRNA pseudouridine32 synthase/23S rRNA pseudouridine746 synthase
MELFQTFKTNITTIPLPEKFTFPFYYEPHQLSVIAAKALQNYLETQNDFQHNFGLNDIQQGLVIGKMFGVLVVQNQNNELGFLWAFSGKLAESNQHPLFVPTVFDMLTENSFFKREETILNQYNKKIEKLENDENHLAAVKHLEKIKQQAAVEIKEQKEQIKSNKKLRAEKRKTLTAEAIEQLNKESQEEGILLKKMTSESSDFIQ